jgi:cytoplasmic iron level regulating protein YaaA (DUF328/UPF0246 family)
MIVVISPAKKLDFTGKRLNQHDLPQFKNETLQLIKGLQELSHDDIKSLMGVSDNIAQLNYNRFQKFTDDYDLANSTQALLAFKGDVYQSLQAENFDDSDIKFANNHLRILSGLYGVLRPLDLMQPYRLEMGTRLPNAVGKNLYEFWGDKITDNLNQELDKQKNKVLINLASNEYFKAVKPKNLEASLINIDFKENRDGKLKTIGIMAKKARGSLARFIIKNSIQNPEDIKNFNQDHYEFSSNSTENNYIFIR